MKTLDVSAYSGALRKSGWEGSKIIETFLAGGSDRYINT